MSKNYCNKSVVLVLLLGLFILGLGLQACFAAATPGTTVTPNEGVITDPPAPPPPPGPNPNTPPSQIDAISVSEVELATRQDNKTTLDEEQKIAAEKKLVGNIYVPRGKDLVMPTPLDYKGKD